MEEILNSDLTRSSLSELTKGEREHVFDSATYKLLCEAVAKGLWTHEAEAKHKELLEISRLLGLSD